MGWRVLYCQPNDLCMEAMAAVIKAAMHPENPKAHDLRSNIVEPVVVPPNGSNEQGN